MARILIIDDDSQIRKILSLTLIAAGFEVLEAKNGRVAMKLFRESPVDLVITDLIMPDKEGIETIMELKKDFPSVKIVAISGGGKINPKNYLELAEKLGAQATVEKPFSRNEILETVFSLFPDE